MWRFTTKVSLALLSGLLIIHPAYASYIDPGAGSLILQSLVGGIAAGFAVIALYYARIKTWMGRLFSQAASKSDRSAHR